MPRDRLRTCCAECAYFDPHDPADELSEGSCRRLPPRAADDDANNGIWPTVQVDEWCGEWKAPTGL